MALARPVLSRPDPLLHLVDDEKEEEIALITSCLWPWYDPVGQDHPSLGRDVQKAGRAQGDGHGQSGFRGRLQMALGAEEVQKMSEYKTSESQRAYQRLRNWLMTHHREVWDEFLRTPRNPNNEEKTLMAEMRKKGHSR